MDPWTSSHPLSYINFILIHDLYFFFSKILNFSIKKISKECFIRDRAIVRQRIDLEIVAELSTENFIHILGPFKILLESNSE